MEHAEPPAGPDPHWQEVADCLGHLRLFPRIEYLWKNDWPAPDDLRKLSKADQFSSSARNLLLASDQRAILAKLCSRGIQAFPVKGVSLAQLLHQTTAARTVSDIDLAVAAQDVAQAAEVLRELGFVPQLPTELLRRKDFLAGTSVNTSELVCIRQDERGRVLVELHWKLFPFDMGQPWPRHCYPGLAEETLPPTEYFFYLCSRFAAHGCADLSKLCDIGDFLLRFEGELDAQKFAALARQAQATLAVQASLALLQALFGLRWTGAVIDSRARYCAQRLLRRPLARKLTVSALAFHREQVSFADHWSARMRYVARLLQPTREEWLHGQQVRSRPTAWLIRAARLARLMGEQAMFREAS